MPTFTLSKYKEKDLTKPETTEEPTEEKSEITVTVSGSVAEIVANALYSKFGNKVEIEKTEESNDNPDVKIVSTEAINKDPITTFKNIYANETIFISNKGFKTAKEEWFLTNLPNKTNNVMLTLESFVKHIETKLNLSNE